MITGALLHDALIVRLQNSRGRRLGRRLERVTAGTLAVAHGRSQLGPRGQHPLDQLERANAFFVPDAVVRLGLMTTDDHPAHTRLGAIRDHPNINDEIGRILAQVEMIEHLANCQDSARDACPVEHGALWNGKLPRGETPGTTPSRLQEPDRTADRTPGVSWQSYEASI